jgi:hypothetical protein
VKEANFLPRAHIMLIRTASVNYWTVNAEEISRIRSLSSLVSVPERESRAHEISIRQFLSAKITAAAGARRYCHIGARFGLQRSSPIALQHLLPRGPLTLCRVAASHVADINWGRNHQKSNYSIYMMLSTQNLDW